MSNGGAPRGRPRNEQPRHELTAPHRPTERSDENPLVLGGETFHDDKQLIAELTDLNDRISRYVLRHLDAEAGRFADQHGRRARRRYAARATRPFWSWNGPNGGGNRSRSTVPWRPPTRHSSMDRLLPFFAVFAFIRDLSSLAPFGRLSSMNNYHHEETTNVGAFGMTTNKPEAAVWLDIPEDCRISGEFTGDLDIHVVFGDVKDGVEMLFERPALERFVTLANELLAVSIPDDPKTDLPTFSASPS